MMLTDSVQQLVLQLNANWFNAKRAEFIKEPFYSKDEDRIYETAPISVDMDIISYCWNGHYPGGSYSHEEEEVGPLPVNASTIAEKIVLAIDAATHMLPNDAVKDGNIMEAMKAVRDALEQMQAENIDDVHTDVLDNFLTRLSQKVTAKWRYLKQAIDAYNAHRHMLYLDLKLDELAVLVKILDEAGIFRKATKNDNAHIAFIAKHVCFKNQRREGEYTIAAGIGKAISAVINHDVSSKVVRDMKSKLMAALQALK